MTSRGLAVAALSLLMLAVPASASSTTKAGPKRDWARTVSATPDGGFRMGNPKAKIELVEYGSLTCPHCRHFAETAMKPLLSRYVRTGKATYEYRSFVLNGIDLSATIVARCGGPAHFFPMADALYATQPTWIGRITGAESEKLNALPQSEMVLGVAKVAGLIPVAAAHGIPQARTEACLTSDASVSELERMAQAASDRGVQGTPTFFVNGKKVDAYDWATLEPFLKETGS
ncbi:MAG: DsbA family protein [Sphingomicrobium sp.]